MAKDWRKGALWLIAVLFAAVLGGWAVMSWRMDGPAQAARSMSGPPDAATASTLPASAALAGADGACKQAPLLARKGDDDGQERLQAKPAGASADEVASLIRTGKEAAASGRQRDAEVSFLNACRNAALLQGDDAITLADAMYQLARLYANAAALGAARPKELYERAEELYGASLAAYTGRYGPANEKTKFAQQGLATVQVATGHSGAGTVAKAVEKPAAVPQAVPAPAPAPTPAQAPAPEAKAPEPAKPAAEPKPKPEEKEAAAPAPEELEAKVAPAKKRVRQAAPEPVEQEKEPAAAQARAPEPEPVAPRPRAERRRAAPPPPPEETARETVREPAPVEEAPRPPRVVRTEPPEPAPEPTYEPPPAASMGAPSSGDAAPTAEGSTGL